MITFSEYYTLLMEDLQSSLNQAKNILQNNNAGENVQNIISKLEQIYNEVQFEDEQHRQANKDSNIPALAFWIVADPNFDRIREDYRQYVNTRSLYQKNFLINSMENLKKEISNRKLFKPSEEKLSLIKQTFAKVAETIHSQYKPVVKANDKKFVAGEANEDVVYEDDVITVYRADSKAKCIRYGAGSSLCISVKGGGNYYWSYRMGNMRNDGLGMTTYFVYWKDGSNRILIDALGDEDGPANKYSWNPITPNTDRDIQQLELIGKYPELKKPFLNDVFQFIPFGEREQRYQYISQNVHYLLDPELKTLEDYEMFIEDYEESDALNYGGWDGIAKKLGEPQAAYLVKKYAGLGNFADIETQKRFLTPKDREWYLDIISEEENPEDLLRYCEFVKGEQIPEKMIRNLLKDGSYYNEYLWKVVGFDYEICDIIIDRLRGYFIEQQGLPSHTYMDSDEIVNSFVDFLMGRNVTPKLLNSLLKNPTSMGISNIPSELISYYAKNNITIPKPLYKSIVSDPYIAYKFNRHWISNKNTKPPRILLKTIIKNPITAYYYAKDLRFRGTPVPEEVEKAILTNPEMAYMYIDNNRNFEKYSEKYLVWLFSSGINGFKFADDNDGYGIFKKDWGKRSMKNIRRAILKNIMDNPKRAYERVKYYPHSWDREGRKTFYKMLDHAAKNYKESYKLSQLNTLLEL
jgi:hypothetical protein